MSDYDPDEDLTADELAAAWERGVPAEVVAVEPSSLLMPAADTSTAGRGEVRRHPASTAASPMRVDTGQPQRA